MTDLSIDINEINKISKEAGDIILAHYESKTIDFDKKSDDSPVTKADIASHNHILQRLKEAYPKIMIISEEDKQNDSTPIKLPEYYWLVDPLDGTKGYIEKNDEFSVNIALIQNQDPILGVVYLPVLKTLYFASDAFGKSFKQVGSETIEEIFCPLPTSNKINLSINRSHKISESDFKDSDYEIELFRMSAAGKFGIVAEGLSHLYFRNGPTCEWDTAAGHCIINNANGEVVTLDGKELKYGKENYLNPEFIALGHEDLPYKKILEGILP